MDKPSRRFSAHSELRPKKRWFRQGEIMPSQTNRGILVVSGIVGSLIGLFVYPLTLFMWLSLVVVLPPYTGPNEFLVAIALLLIWGMYAGLAALYKFLLNYGATHLDQKGMAAVEMLGTFAWLVHVVLHAVIAFGATILACAWMGSWRF